jgi:hypothetical protein
MLVAPSSATDIEQFLTRIMPIERWRHLVWIPSSEPTRRDRNLVVGHAYHFCGNLVAYTIALGISPTGQLVGSVCHRETISSSLAVWRSDREFTDAMSFAEAFGEMVHWRDWVWGDRLMQSPPSGYINTGLTIGRRRRIYLGLTQLKPASEGLLAAAAAAETIIAAWWGMASAEGRRKTVAAMN